MAGLTVGAVSYFIGKKLILDWIEVRTTDLAELVKPGTVINLDRGRQHGEISPNFEAFFTGLDRELKAIQSEAHTTEAVAHRVEDSVTQTLTTLIHQTTQSGLSLARSGASVFQELSQQQAIFSDLHACGEQVVQTQEQLAEMTTTESVIAARAGLAGKGFAVVASEMRTQSNVSAEQARDLKTNLAIAQEFVQGERSIAQAVEVFGHLRSSSEESRTTLTRMESATQTALDRGQTLVTNVQRVSATQSKLRTLASQLQQSAVDFSHLENRREADEASHLFSSVQRLNRLLARFRHLEGRSPGHS